MEFNHLTLVCMTYVQHLKFSLKLSGLFFYGGACALVHAVFPFILAKKSTIISNMILHDIKHSGCL